MPLLVPAGFWCRMYVVIFIIAPPQESELPADHPPQEPLLLLRAKFSAHHHLPGGGGQQPRGGEQKPGEFSLSPASFRSVLGCKAACWWPTGSAEGWSAATTSSKGLKFSFPDFRQGWNRFLGAPFGLSPPTLISRAKDAFLVLLIRMLR